LRGRASSAIVGNEEAIQPALVETMKAAPARLQQRIAEQLASDHRGAEALLKLVQDGAASPQLLLRPAISSRLGALGNDTFQAEIGRLTSGLPSASEEIHALIASRIGQHRAAGASAEAGVAVFRKHCAACHKIGNEGAVVGPQLDGIGNRGLERIVEDLLDPNRNVDVAFRTTTFVLVDGKAVSGLVRREEGNVIVLVDNQGKEFTVPKDDVDERVGPQLSLMPANVVEVVPEKDFYDLVAYLLSQRQKIEGQTAEESKP
jgi:putative heme-binding domain-containing protein